METNNVYRECSSFSHNFYEGKNKAVENFVETKIKEELNLKKWTKIYYYKLPNSIIYGNIKVVYQKIHAFQIWANSLIAIFNKWFNSQDYISLSDIYLTEEDCYKAIRDEIQERIDENKNNIDKLEEKLKLFNN